MVGGPPGTNFGAASRLLAYTSQTGYSAPSSSVSNGCRGLWAYFDKPTSVSLPMDSSVQTAICALPAGWGLLGDPFSQVAELLAGEAGFFWDSATQRYDLLRNIGVGQSIWVYSSTARAITLTTQSATISATPTISINALAPNGVYQVHISDTIEVFVPLDTPYQVSVSSGNAGTLQYITSGVRGDLSCIGDPSCALSFTTRFWIYKAIAPGTATIVLSAACRPACGLPSRAISIEILA